MENHHNNELFSEASLIMILSENDHTQQVVIKEEI